MDEEKTLTQAPVTDDFQKRVSPYDLLMRQSRKMGGVATRTYDITKEFLKQDVSTLHPDKILFGLKTTSKDRQTRWLNNERPSVNTDTQDEDAELGHNDNDSSGTTNAATPGSVEARTAEGIRENQERDTRTLDPREGLRKIVRKSHQLLASAQTVILPVNLFPDSVTVDRTKVTITKRTFFWSSSVISIRIEDVLNVACSTGPIFGSLTVSSRVMNSTDHYEIDYFWRKDALYMKQLIQGYVIAQHNQIETSHLKRDELIRTLLDLGNDSDY